MNTLSAILLATAAGGVLSTLLAALAAVWARPRWVPVMVSYAIGALLTAALLGIVPEALELTGSVEKTGMALLAGILLFFLLEKLVLWRHCHEEDCAAHGADGHDHGRSGIMITLGDTLHNFVDGLMLAGAFLADFQLGVVMAIAVIAHEIPQEIGDFLILIHSGFSRARALALNLLAGLAMVLGGLLGYFALESLRGGIGYLLALAAASMIYVSLSDLIPGLHRRTRLRDTAAQLLLIGLGSGTILVVRELAGAS